MPTLNSVITDFVAGDDLEVRRTVGSLVAPLTDAWLTIKEWESDTDAQAIIQKAITSVVDLDQGQIIETGDLNTDATIVFYLTATETALLQARPYFFDIQVLDDNTHLYTPESGLMIPVAAITRTTTPSI